MTRVPGSPEWHAHVDALRAAEAQQPLGWWYLSFASETAFLGGCFVQARGFTTAIGRAHDLRINPGGQVGACRIESPGPFPVNQLLSRAEMQAIEAARRQEAN